MTPQAEADQALQELARGRLGAGSKAALEAFERAWPSLERHLATFQRALRVPSETWEDCGQAALTRVWMSRSQYRGTTSGEFLAWLYRICQHEHLRSIERASRSQPSVENDDLRSPDSTSSEVEVQDERTALETCIQGLEPEQRQVIELLYSADEPNEREVAVMIDRSKSRVNQLRQSALAALKRCLRRGGSP